MPDIFLMYYATDDQAWWEWIASYLYALDIRSLVYYLLSRLANTDPLFDK